MIALGSPGAAGQAGLQIHALHLDTRRSAERNRRLVGKSDLDRFSNIGAVRSVRLGRSSDISALPADIAQDEWQIAPQTLDVDYATSEPCLCASFAVTGEVTGNCSTVAC
jgi:hypothetical protein